MQTVMAHSQSTGTARTVAIAFAFYPPPGTNLAYPSNRRLEAEWGLSEKTVQRALITLRGLGEFQDQPRMITATRPRVFRIDPTFRRQPSLLAGHADLSGVARLSPDMSPVTSRGRVVGREIEGLTETPLTPRGGDVPGLGLFESSTTAPRQRPESAAAARRRPSRRRRGRRAPTSVTASEPCPLSGLTDSEAAALLEAQGALERSLLDAWGESSRAWQHWVGWRKGWHLHADGDTIVIGSASNRYASLQERIAELFSEVAGRPVMFVCCDEAPVLAEGASA